MLAVVALLYIIDIWSAFPNGCTTQSWSFICL